MLHFPYRIKITRNTPPTPPISVVAASSSTTGSAGVTQDASSNANQDDDSSPKWLGFLRFLFVLLGSVSFLGVWVIGIMTISPSVLPDSVRATCVSERESSQETSLEDKDENGIPDFPMVSQAGKNNRKCAAQQVPTELLICASALTGFFFLGVSAQLFRGIKIRIQGVEIEGPPSLLAADTVNATAAGAVEYGN